MKDNKRLSATSVNMPTVDHFGAHEGEKSLFHGADSLAALTRLVADRAFNPALHRIKVCLLLGAGADISSGGLSFAELKRQAVEKFSGREVFDVTQPDDVEARFEKIFLRLHSDERALVIEALSHRTHALEPSDAYKLLVLLIEAGGIDAVITTNFDTMLEKAQRQLGRDLLQVFASGVARPFMLSSGRFESPKKPYLKLHGDLASRSVTFLTSAELENSNYDSSMLELLRSILRTHDLIIAGYGGYDSALAKIVSDAIHSTENRVFWCNPRSPSLESPLFSQIADRARFIQAPFDELIMVMSRPVLERPSLAATEPTYIRCLFDWRVEYCNREYLQAYGERAGRSIVDSYARREGIERRLACFLLPNHPMALLVGPSGFGKTTVGIRLSKTWGADNTTRILLIRSRALPESGDVEQYIAEQLGGLGSHAPFSIFKLERWLRESNLRLVLFVDGINEFSAELGRCVHFFRNILRFCYFLPEWDSALRVIATVRQETWSAMLPHLDAIQLQKVLWLDDDARQSFSAITCGPLTDEEVSDALARLRDQGLGTIDLSQLPRTVAKQLRDPYLLGMIAEAVNQGLPPVPSARIYQRGFESKLRRRDSFIDLATLKDILSSLAVQCLGAHQDRFREIDIQPTAMRGEVVRLMKDLHVFVDAGDGFLQFDHDRTFEYFLALGLASTKGPHLESMEDLQRFLRRFRTESKAIAAARLYFQLAPSERFSLIATALGLLDTRDHHYGIADREMLFGFAREVLLELVEQGEPLAQQYIEDAIGAARVGRIGEHQLRTIVQSAAALPVDRAVTLLTKVEHPTSSLASTEARIYATDKLVKQYFSSGCPAIDLFQTEPYAAFFGERAITSWQRLGRLLGFASQIGPDNTHPDEYDSSWQVMNSALDRCFRESSWTQADATQIAAYFLENCDRLLFNATPRGIHRFFGNPKRMELEKVVDKLAQGGVLDDSDFRSFEPYTQSLSADIEYHLAHLMFVLSSFNDVEATLRLAETRFASFNNDTPPEEIDFFHAVLVYLHILHGLPYDEARFGWWEEKTLRDWPDVLLYRPGVERGERRGFQDMFDRVFEDGFGVLYSYGILSPSRRRRRVRYPEYQEALANETATQLPLYSKFLDEFLRTERIEAALQILQALGGVIVVWPTEGLLTLRGVIGYPEPRVRRATVRVLAEAFNRFPEETLRFLSASGASVSDQDLIEIKIRQDARIGRRQVEEAEWARIGHCLLRRPGGRQAFIAGVRSLLSARTYEEAVVDVLYAIGVSSPTGR